MAKIDKSQYTKQEWRQIRNKRRLEKDILRSNTDVFKDDLSKNEANQRAYRFKTAFVIGNGMSRRSIDLEQLRPHGALYACNAVYRDFRPDFLIAVDVKMVIEINKHGFQKNNQVWTNPNKAYDRIKNLNFFQPSKGWSSGPTALWLANEHQYERIFILGFDYQGLKLDSKNPAKFNNIFADTPNYKKSSDGATFFGNWLRQTVSVVKENPKTQFVRVNTKENYNPPELNKFENFTNLDIEDFKKIFTLS